MTFNTNAIIDELNFVQLRALAESCQARMSQMRAERKQQLAEEFERRSQEEVGLSLSDVAATLKKKRGRPKKHEDSGWKEE